MQVKTKEKNSDWESDGDAKSGVEIGGVCKSNLGTQGAEVTKCASDASLAKECVFLSLLHLCF